MHLALRVHLALAFVGQSVKEIRNIGFLTYKVDGCQIPSSYKTESFSRSFMLTHTHTERERETDRQTDRET